MSTLTNYTLADRPRYSISIYPRIKEEILLKGIQIRFEELFRPNSTEEDVNAFIMHAQSVIDAELSKRITYVYSDFLSVVFLQQGKNSEAIKCARAVLPDIPANSAEAFRISARIANLHLLERKYRETLKLKYLLNYLPQKQPYLNRTYTTMTLALTNLSQYEDAIETAFAMAVTSTRRKTLETAFRQNQLIFEKLIEKQSDEKVFLPFLALYCAVRKSTEFTSIANLQMHFLNSSIPDSQKNAFTSRVIEFQRAIEKALEENNPDQRNPAFDVLMSLSSSLEEQKDFEVLIKILIPIAHLAENAEEIQKLYSISSRVFNYLFDRKEYSNAIKPLRAMLILSYKEDSYLNNAFTQVFGLAHRLIINKRHGKAKSLLYSALSAQPSDPLKAILKLYSDEVEAKIRDKTGAETLILLSSGNEARMNELSLSIRHQKPEIDDEPERKRTPEIQDDEELS